MLVYAVSGGHWQYIDVITYRWTLTIYCWWLRLVVQMKWRTVPLMNFSLSSRYCCWPLLTSLSQFKVLLTSGIVFGHLGVRVGVKSCKIVFLGALPIHLFSHFCCGMYHLATVHSVTDRQTDDIIMPLSDTTACSTVATEVFLAHTGAIQIR